ncbi:MAG: rhodanese-like domain-containing protein [Candidatus Bipolaricaulota bacterium]|nr:rhodanese-like domain-containing protein [Candidatus Bipolaricaulota bacterium]MBS3792323.1 rhodanese-like domain-containing protein [Candidatus Bipolaricaulota bacterium]
MNTFNRKTLAVLTLSLVVLLAGSLAVTAQEDVVVNAADEFLNDIHENGFLTVSQEEVNTQRKVRSDLFILDVRTPGEVEEGKIPGAKAIRLSNLAQKIDELPDDKDTTMYVYCKGGTRAAYAVAVLQSLGYTEAYNMGGFVDWKEAGYPVES